MHQNFKRHIVVLAALATCGLSAQAADWSDTSIGYRYGTQFREPVNSNDIKKDIFFLTHVSGYKYGSNFFNVDLLQSDSKDPSGVGSTAGAHEAYIVYRHFLDIGKVSGKDFKAGPMRGWGVTAGFDWNSKTDAGYNSKKRMLVLGPTVEFDVPGFLNVSLLELWESNAPCNNYNAGTAFPVCVSRYSYKAHPMLTAAWGIPVFSLPLSFEGYANFIASKGHNEFGGSTAAEINIDAQLMYDVGSLWGTPKTFKLGLEYQYWKNKFGNDNGDPFYQGGATARTPMIRAEYHF
ncbi:MAG TPA: outer envelope protein [Methylibium sp.]